MMIFLSLILALALLAGIIFMLRQHQERTRQTLVARQQPLPSLTDDTETGDTRQSDNSMPTPSGPAIASAAPRPAPEPEPLPEPEPAIEDADWRLLCQRLRDQGRYQEAVSVCRQAWPQWQSFDHAARVMRAAVRNSATGTATHQQWLQRLYHLAVHASFLHDKVDGLPDPTRQLLAQHFEPQQIDALDMPWSQIGYRDLRLLTKSDRKQLVTILGEPATHQSARIFHDKQWLTAIS